MTSIVTDGGKALESFGNLRLKRFTGVLLDMPISLSNLQFITHLELCEIRECLEHKPSFPVFPALTHFAINLWNASEVDEKASDWFSEVVRNRSLRMVVFLCHSFSFYRSLLVFGDSELAFVAKGQLLRADWEDAWNGTSVWERAVPMREIS